MSTTNDMSFPFMQLPPELRSEVYSYLYLVKYPSVFPRYLQAKFGDLSGRWATHVVPTSLLQASRTIKSEAEDGLRRVNLHCTPALVGQSADARLFKILLHSLQSAHRQDANWLLKAGSSSSSTKHKIDEALLKTETKHLALQLNKTLTRHRHEVPWVKARHVHNFMEWTLLRLRHTSSVNVLFRVHVSISRPRSALSGGNYDIWSSAALLKNAERGGLIVAHQIKILTARHIERAVLEDQLGDWKVRLDELGVTWGVASQNEALERLFPGTFNKDQAVDHDEPSQPISDH